MQYNGGTNAGPDVERETLGGEGGDTSRVGMAVRGFRGRVNSTQAALLMEPLGLGYGNPIRPGAIVSQRWTE